VESWFSALALNQANLNAVCVFGLQNMKHDHPMLKSFRDKYEIIWVPDCDETFSQFYNINKESARLMKVVYTVYKDAADMAVQVKDFRTAFNLLKIKSLREIFMSKKLSVVDSSLV